MYIKYIASFILGRKILNDQESHMSKFLFSAYEADFDCDSQRQSPYVVIADIQLSTYSSCISDTIHKMKGRNPADKTFRNQADFTK